MKPSNWMTKAAEEIVEIDAGCFYLTIDVEQITEILVKHVPFKDGVAYMPVPRCDTCTHWNRTHQDNLGDCELTHGEDSDGCSDLDRRPLLETKAYADVGGDEFGQPVLVTTKDFGCVQWKEKP